MKYTHYTTVRLSGRTTAYWNYNRIAFSGCDRTIEKYEAVAILDQYYKHCAVITKKGIGAWCEEEMLKKIGEPHDI